ncbi:DHA2 family methylenomycin A resistance protein-like MFS transporter [Streptomyces canus]|uniref:DHA2 family methylenomycin A resistance protein-like MFS transporter n=1 Tax=Streptomyces canus TaxID=58343 RepID=A0AAW8FTE4_9ACTN|nr:MFS transporter [Streptomyces canus]MDQ0913356.1 DHA2 family methylenomycin A resistance protein-like MFS transporter [Streptomyces canus]
MTTADSLPLATGTAAPPAPEAPASPARSRLTFVGIAAGNLLVLLDTSILNVAVPDVQKSLHPAAAALPWAVDAYTVVFAGLLLAGGVIADRWGARRVYASALGLFAVLSAVCAAAPDVGALIGGRALLGAAGAGLVPASLALLIHLNPDPARRTRAIGAWTALSGLGAAAGPVLGGGLVELGGWRLVFLVNPPIALAALLIARRLPVPPLRATRALDRPGLLLSTLGLGLLTFGLVESGIEGWGSPFALVPIVAALLAFAVLAFVESRVASPVLPPALLALPKVRAAMVAAAVSCFAYFGGMYMFAVWMQHTYSLTPFKAGLACLPIAFPVCVMPFFTGRLVARFGPRPILLTGMSAAVVSGVLLTFCVGSNPPLALLVAAELTLAATGTLSIPGAAAAMAMSAPPEYAATSQGALNGIRQAGSALGVAVLGTLGALTTSGHVLVVVGLLAVLLVARATRTDN